MKTAIATILGMLVPLSGFGAAPAGVFVRVALLSPREVPWRMHIVVHQPEGKQAELFTGKDLAATAAKAGWIEGRQSGWIELSRRAGQGRALSAIPFRDRPAMEGKGVEAQFDVATAASEADIVRSITEHDTAM